MTELDSTTSGISLFDELLVKPSTTTEQNVDAVLEGSATDDEKNSRSEPPSLEATKQMALEGHLPSEAKKALVHLYRAGSILYSENKERYELLCRYEHQVRSHMDNVYMSVVFDRKAGHIFTEVASPEDDDEEPARLITARPLTLYQSLLLVVLRKFFQEREATGENKIIIDFERLSSFMVPFLEISQSERKESGRLNKAVSYMLDKRILLKVRGEEYRYQISPIIRNVVNAELLESLLNEYKKMLENQEVSSNSEGGT